MPTYKLIYFDAKGLAEPARQLFALANQPYEDIRYQFAEWPALKPKMPYAAMPVLEVDGEEIAQSGAINRFLARKFGYAGKTPIEEAQVDAFADQLKDFFAEIVQYFIVQNGMKEGDLEKIKNEVVIPARDKHFPILEKVLKNNKSGFAVGDSLTYADLHLAHFYQYFEERCPGVFDISPVLAAHEKKIHSIPAIANWIATRPKTRI